MRIPKLSIATAAQLTPLAAGVAALFALSAPQAQASTTWSVTNCSDHDPGSLRDVVSNVSVMSGDTVDMSTLVCSPISLKTGAITINQASLVLQGPASHALQIRMLFLTPVPDTLLFHTGTGTLAVNDLRLIYGYGHEYAAGSHNGGCIYSAGNVVLQRSEVAYCAARVSAASGQALGGGIRTLGNLTVIHSSIHDNVAGSYDHGAAVDGGGAHVHGNLIAKYSTISNNKAIGPNTSVGQGGGVFVRGSVEMYESVISSNSATGATGGLYQRAIGSQTVTIANSTISGNTAAVAAGLSIQDTPAVIRASTVAFNHDRLAMGTYSPGLTAVATYKTFTVDLQSSLFSNNTYSTVLLAVKDDDLAVQGNAYTVNISGANNLVYHADASVGVGALPPDTITGQCPLLAPLHNNGGTTQSHALYSHSPAIDTGNNTGKLDYDQRGGPETPPIAQPPVGYPRVSGIGPDIGAFEMQQGDTIFYAGLEGCL